MSAGQQTAPTQALGKLALEPFDGRRLSVLLLCDDNSKHAGAILDHIAQFVDLSQHRIFKYNPCGQQSTMLDLAEFDVVVIHYSLVITIDHFLSPMLRERIHQFDGLKIQVIQDDYRWIEQITAMQRYLGIHVLYTLVPAESHDKVWCSRVPGLTAIQTIPGHVPDYLLGIKSPPIGSRTIDIGYRGRYLGYWLGELAQEKRWIAEGVSALAPQYGLNCDISCSEESRIYGQDWFKFLGNCKTILGTEGGVSITDFDGSIEKQVHAYMKDQPRADFREVQRAVLMPYENNVRMALITPRVFETVAMRTPLVLFPGPYSGILEPWQHYIPLEKDFSNFGDVVDRIRDTRFLEEMSERAYVDLIASGKYSQRDFVGEFDRVITTFAKRHRQTRTVNWFRKRYRPRYRLALVEKDVVRKPIRIGGRTRLILFTAWTILTNAASRSIFGAWLLNDFDFRLGTTRKFVRELVRLALLERRRQARATNAGFRLDATFHREHRVLRLVSRPLDPMIEETPRATLPAPAIADLRPQYVMWDHHAISPVLQCILPLGARLVFDMETSGGFRLEIVQRMLARELETRRNGPVSRWLASILTDAPLTQTGEFSTEETPTYVPSRFPRPMAWLRRRLAPLEARAKYLVAGYLKRLVRTGASIRAFVAVEPTRAMLVDRCLNPQARHGSFAQLFKELARLAVLERKLGQPAEDYGFRLSVDYARPERRLKLVSRPSDERTADLARPLDATLTPAHVDPQQIVWEHAAIGPELVDRTLAGHVRFDMRGPDGFSLSAIGSMLAGERAQGRNGPVSRWLTSIFGRCPPARPASRSVPMPQATFESCELSTSMRNSA